MRQACRAPGFGEGGLPGGGAPAAQCLPMKAIQDHARFFLIAWREEVPKTLSSFQPPRYAIPSTAIEQRASPIVFAQHATQAQSSCHCFRSALFWLLQLEIQCIDILQPLSTAPILRRPQRAEPAVVFARSIASI